ncbi:MAG: SMC family ATPase [Thermoplasmata archaeon]|nr:SMC family ATPase [Thermoplasmata archaeon]
MILRSLSLKNFRKFKSAEIEFPDGIVGIIGLNGVGKSTIFEALAWALYGSIAARTSVSEIKRVGASPSESCKVELNFLFGGNDYRVVREVNGKSSNATLVVNGKTIANGSEGVNKYIEKLLGMDYKSFFTSVYAKQKELNVLSAMRPHERKPLILGMLGIDAVDDVIKKIRDDAKNKKNILDRLRIELLDENGKPKTEKLRREIEDLTKEKEKISEEIHQLEEKLERKRKELLALEKKQKEKKLRYEDISRSVEELERRKEKYLRKKNLEDEIEEIKKKIKERKDRLKVEKEKAVKYEGIEEEIGKVEDKIKEISSKLDAIKKERNEKEAFKEYKRKEILEIEKRKKEIEKLGPDAKCPTCERVLENHYYNLLEKISKEIRKREKESSVLSEQIKKIEEKQDIVEKELDALQKRIKHLSEERRELDKINATIRSLLEEIEEGEKSLVEKSKELEEIKHVSFEKDEYERKIIEKNKVYEEYQLVLEEYSNKKDENNRLKLELEKAKGNKKVLEQKIGSIKEQVDNLERIKKRIGDETADLEYLQLLVDIMSSFRTDLISRIRPMLSAYASEFFERLTDGKYKLIELDEDYNIKILDDGRAYGIKRFSGGEEDLANLCLRLAISEIVSERADRQFNFIILDEIFGSQDSIRRQNIMQALNALSSKFRQIFLITHIEDIKNFMENVIHVIENEDGTSYVKVD